MMFLHHPRRCLALALLALLPGASLAAASVIPPDAVAWWRFDPSHFRAAQAPAAKRTAFLALLRTVLASRVVDSQRASNVIQALLAAAEVGSTPHTLCVLGFSASRPPGQVNGMQINSLQIVLELQGRGDHAQHLRTIQTILMAPDADDAVTRQAPARAQRPISLPGGLTGASYSEQGWPPWRELSWVSTNDSFLIAIGRGALERWLDAQRSDPQRAPTPPRTPPWSPHLRLVNEGRPQGVNFLEAFVSLDAIRRGFPEAFTHGRARRVFSAMKLSNARDFMLHGRWLTPPATGAKSPPLIAIDATWSARSSRPGLIERRVISESTWPADLRMPPPPGSYIIALRADWLAWLDRIFVLIEAATPDSKRAARAAALRRWREIYDGSLRQSTARLTPWLILSDTPTPVVPVPGAATLFIELRPGADAEAIQRAITIMLGRSKDKLRENKAGAHWISLVPGGVLRAPAWGFAKSDDLRVLIAGWSPAAVTSNQVRLSKQPQAQP